MATSQNLWPVLSGYSDPKLVTIPFITGKMLGGDVAWVFTEFNQQFHDTIESLTGGVADDWGFAPRPIAGTNVISNHASGTAEDLNASRHPMFRDTMDNAKEAKIRALVKKFKGAIRWGGDYRVGRIDQMHFEINVTPARLKVIVAELKAEKAGTVKPASPSKPKPKPETPAKPAVKPKPVAKKSWPDVPLKVQGSHTAASDAAWRELLADVGYRDKNLTTSMQRWLKARGYYKGLIEADSGKTPVFGPMLVDALQRKLRDDGFYKGQIDGLKKPIHLSRGPLLITAEIKFLNDQAQYYK